jgi:predicted SprT family Zn-dependent metalloprotease
MLKYRSVRRVEILGKYQYKCSCGQPYNVKPEGDYPMKDEFTRVCPSCGKTLTYKACCMSTDWEFDKSFEKVN